jgi:hypothetical protein
MFGTCKSSLYFIQFYLQIKIVLFPFYEKKERKCKYLEFFIINLSLPEKRKMEDQATETTTQKTKEIKISKEIQNYLNQGRSKVVKINSKGEVQDKKSVKEITGFDTEKSAGWLGDKKAHNVETPKDLYELLNEEFKFDFDPCPFQHDLKLWDGLKVNWKKSNFVNPPYDNISEWVKKAINEMKNGNSSIFLITARTSSKYWIESVYNYAKEIRFLKTGVFFEGYKQKIPFPLAIVVFEAEWYLKNLKEIENNKTETLRKTPKQRKYVWTTMICKNRTKIS